MQINVKISNEPKIGIALENYAHTPARYSQNPFDGVGILHNIVLDLAEGELQAKVFEGKELTRNLALGALRSVFERFHSWELFCFCVHGEGCPCFDLFKIFGGKAPDMGLFDQIPTDRPTSEGAIEQARKHFTDRLFSQMKPFLEEMIEIADSASCEGAAPRDFLNSMTAFEARLIESNLPKRCREQLLMASSVARHSFYREVTGGGATAAAPDWFKDDMLGAVGGGAIGGPWGGVILGGVASYRTAKGLW